MAMTDVKWVTGKCDCCRTDGVPVMEGRAGECEPCHRLSVAKRMGPSSANESGAITVLDVVRLFWMMKQLQAPTVRGAD